MKLIKRIAFGSAGLLVLLMMTATVVEKLQGTGTAWTAIYGSPFFTMLWGIMAVCALVYLISRRMQRDFFTFLLHIAFLVILAGALTTRLCGKQGSIHLRMNDTPVSAFVTSGTEEEPLPFSKARTPRQAAGTREGFLQWSLWRRNRRCAHIPLRRNYRTGRGAVRTSLRAHRTPWPPARGTS